MDSQQLLGKEEVKMIAETRNILDELLETLDILADMEAMGKLRDAKEDAKRGRLHTFSEL